VKQESDFMKFDTSVREWRAAVDDAENYFTLVGWAV
jgi:hypothetical protein